MAFVELLEVASDFAGPLGRRVDFIARFPAKYGRLFAVFHTGIDVFAREQIADCLFEVLDQLRVAPKRVGRFAAECRILANATPPSRLIDEGNDDTDPLAARDFDHAIQNAESFSIKLAGTADVDAIAHV